MSYSKGRQVGSKTWGAAARTQLLDMLPTVGITSLLQNSKVNIKQVSNPQPNLTTSKWKTGKHDEAYLAPRLHQYIGGQRRESVLCVSKYKLLMV